MSCEHGSRGTRLLHSRSLEQLGSEFLPTRRSFRRSRALRAQRHPPLPSSAFALLAVAALLVMPSFGQAQERRRSADPWSGVEEMIVTGSGSSAILLEAPTSVAAFDADYLEAMGAQNIGDVAEFTPNLEITSPFAASNPQLFIRGVGLQDSQSNAASAVAVVADGVYLASAAGQLSQLFDVQSLEVLRGPQGALYGRNASAGVIRLTSNRPVHEVAAGVNVTYGRFNQVDLDGFVNVPVVRDVLAARVAFKYARRDHLGENRCGRFRDIDDEPADRVTFGLGGTKCHIGLVLEPGNPPGNPPLPTPASNVNNRDNWAARTLWLLEPEEDLKFTLNVHGGQNFGKAPSFQNRGVNPVRFGNRTIPGLTTDSQNYLDPDTCTRIRQRLGGDPECVQNNAQPGEGSPYSGDYSRVGDERLTLIGASIITNWTDGPWTLEAVVDWEYNDREAVLDIDASPFIAAEVIYDDTATQYYADARLTWDDDTGVALTIGATGLYDRLGATNQIWIQPFTFLGQDIVQKTKYVALFGYLNWELSENLILEGGARLNYERKEFKLSSAVNRFVDGAPFSQTGVLSNERALSEDVRPSGEIILRYEPTEDMKFYWRFSRGYKGRHFNGTAIDANAPIEPVEPEFVNSFELGWSMNFLDGTVAWNGAGYFYDYENQQVFQLQDAEGGGSFPVNTLINAEDSRLIGGESDITIRWEGIQLFQSIGVTYSEFSDFRNVTTVTQTSPQGLTRQFFRVDDFSGNNLVNSPEFSYVAFALYEWEVPGIGTITPRLDWRYKSRVFYTPENDSRIGSDPRWLVDVRLTYMNPEGTFDVSGWIRNVTDELYAVTAFDRKDGNGVIAYAISDPRTYGVSASFRF